MALKSTGLKECSLFEEDVSSYLPSAPEGPPAWIGRDSKRNRELKRKAKEKYQTKLGRVSGVCKYCMSIFKLWLGNRSDDLSAHPDLRWKCMNSGHDAFGSGLCVKCYYDKQGIEKRPRKKVRKTAVIPDKLAIRVMSEAADAGKGRKKVAQPSMPRELLEQAQRERENKKKPIPHAPTASSASSPNIPVAFEQNLDGLMVILPETVTETIKKAGSQWSSEHLLDDDQTALVEKTVDELASKLSAEKGESPFSCHAAFLGRSKQPDACHASNTEAKVPADKLATE